MGNTLIFELAKTLLNVALRCLNFDQRKKSYLYQENVHLCQETSI